MTHHIKTLFSLSAVILMIGCGSLTPVLEAGNGFYSDLPKTEIDKLKEAGKIKISKLEIPAIGCFANQSESVENEIIAPAVKKYLTENNAIAAENVKARRQIAPTVIDSITGAFIWSCSYWSVSGDILQTTSQH